MAVLIPQITQRPLSAASLETCIYSKYWQGPVRSRTMSASLTPLLFVRKPVFQAGPTCTCQEQRLPAWRYLSSSQEQCLPSRLFLYLSGTIPSIMAQEPANVRTAFCHPGLAMLVSVSVSLTIPIPGVLVRVAVCQPIPVPLLVRDAVCQPVSTFICQGRCLPACAYLYLSGSLSACQSQYLYLSETLSANLALPELVRDAVCQPGPSCTCQGGCLPANPYT
jgi:hypothetical protein